uniref:NOL1/NOP2/Sun domain family member 4 n=1 Tax=Panagrellus redivivus TaxID=6233 RepID=A0A7E4VIT1_PANRE
MLRISPVRCIHATTVRGKMARFKPKIARSKPVKTPSTLALDNFDFYYGPLFGDQWPSIRLGLLTPNKFVAVLNRFSMDAEVNAQILKDLGTTNIMDHLVGGKTADSKVIEAKKAAILGKPLVDAHGDVYTEEEAFGAAKVVEEGEKTEEQLEMRLEGGIHEFKEPSETYTMGQLNVKTDGEPEVFDSRRQLSKLEVTGVERFSGNMLRKDDFIMYPRDLGLYAYPRGSLLDFPGPIKDKNQISSWWLLDGGSVLPVLALDLQPTDNVLDMCSAPGGKSLLIAQTGLFDKLTCNDAKMARIGQLRRGLSMYIPPEAPEAQRIVIKRRDASNLEHWSDENCFDKVLVDAPCTTDRLAVNQDDGNLFAPSMTQERLNLPQLQVKLLVNALRSLKINGSVVYSTCSLSPMQNDAVVENAAVIAEQQFGIKVVEKGLTQLQNHLLPSGLYRFALNCQRGLLVVPHIASNFGPMYICKLQRLR